MYKLGRHLENVGIAAPGTGSAVPKAKVPIIKFCDKRTGIKIDISFENDTGLVANKTFRQWKDQYPDMPIIVVLIKQLLAMRGLNEVFTGGLGGFSIICLVVSMLQHLSEAESAAIDPEQRHAVLLLRFLNIYGNEFDVKRTGIVMNPGTTFNKITHPRKKQNANTLTIIDPNNAANDISGGSREIMRVLGVFRTAYFQLNLRIQQLDSGKGVSDSILGCMWGGDYMSFIHQRDKLSKLHPGHRVSPPPGMSTKRAPQNGGFKTLPPKPATGLPERPNKKGYVDLYFDTIA